MNKANLIGSLKNVQSTLKYHRFNYTAQCTCSSINNTNITPNFLPNTHPAPPPSKSTLCVYTAQHFSTLRKHFSDLCQRKNRRCSAKANVCSRYLAHQQEHVIPLVTSSSMTSKNSSSYEGPNFSAKFTRKLKFTKDLISAVICY